MATRVWQGGAPAVAQVTAYVFAGTWEANDVVTLTIGTKTVSVVAGSTTVATVVLNVLTAWNALSADDYPEFAEITASQSTGTLILTADTAGRPFACTVATTETGGGAADAQTIDGAASSTGTDSTACKGPNHWDSVAGWSGAAAPAAADTATVEFSDDDITFGLAQSGVTLAAINLPASFTGTLGLPLVNADGAEYAEYRQRYLAVGATLLNVGHGEGQGSRRILIDNGSVQTAAVVRGTSSPADQNIPAICWKGTHASNAVEVARGSFGAAVFGGEVATIATLRVGFMGSQDSDAQFLGGAGLTLTTLNQSGGTVILNAGLTTVNKAGGSLVINAGSVTTLTNDAGAVAYNGTGTIGTLNLTGLIDFSGDMRPCTVTNCNLYAGARIYDPYGRVTFTNPVQLVRCRATEVTLDVGVNRTLAVA